MKIVIIPFWSHIWVNTIVRELLQELVAASVLGFSLQTFVAA